MLFELEIDAATAAAALASAAQDVEDLGPENLRTDYSGRGTYGETCLALVLDDRRDVTLFEHDLASALAVTEYGTAPDRDDVREFVRVLSGVRCEDSMGLGHVFYWPGATVTGDLADALRGYFDPEAV